MTENLLNAIAPLINFINHKITNTVLAAGVFTAGQTSESVKGLGEIPITEIFSHDISALAWTMLIATGWIIFQFAREAVKGIIWLGRAIAEWRAARGRR